MFDNSIEESCPDYNTHKKIELSVWENNVNYSAPIEKLLDASFNLARPQKAILWVFCNVYQMRGPKVKNVRFCLWQRIRNRFTAA
jgi:hypothetical protein